MWCLNLNIDVEYLSKRISEIINRTSRSVVTIYTEVPSFDIFFGPRVIRGAGSGFIVDRGLLVTNAHVVSNASRVIVVFSDGVRSEGDVVAVDRSRDLALVNFERRDVEPIAIGDSDEITIGEIVFAIGSPLGLTGPSVSMGVVSALGRTIADEERGIVLEDLVQTDAAINPGNSGGPIVNVKGEAVGVATAIIPYAQGIGFAIPINTVKKFIEMIKKYGHPIRAWLGVYVAPLTKEIASLYGLSISEGLIVIQVMPRSPAETYGLKRGDALIEAEGRRLRKPSDLRASIEDHVDSECINLRVIRRNREFNICIPPIVEVVG